MYVEDASVRAIMFSILSIQCFYDNIVFAPFIFVEDPVDVNGQRGFSIEASRALSASSSSGNLSGSTFLSKGTKVDPYYLISNVSLPSPLLCQMINGWAFRIYSILFELMLRCLCP